MIDEAAPGIDKLNDRYAGLLSAEKSLERTQNIKQRHAAISLPDIGAGIGGLVLSGGNPLMGAAAYGLRRGLESTAFKTRAAQALEGIGNRIPLKSVIKGGSKDLEAIYQKAGVTSQQVAKARAEMAAIPETWKINTTQRQIFRKKVADELYGSGAKVKGKRLDIVMGPPAAGKSKVIADPLAEKYGSLLLDADKAKVKIPEFGNGIGANAVHEESAMITEEDLLIRALGNDDNIVLPLVGKNEEKLRKLIQDAKGLGYSIHLHLNDLPPEKATERALKRWLTEGRFLDPEYIMNIVGSKPKEIFGRIKNMRELSSIEHVSNDVPFGELPKRIE
jgi:predicted ABC-type ATPase